MIKQQTHNTVRVCGGMKAGFGDAKRSPQSLWVRKQQQHVCKPSETKRAGSRPQIMAGAAKIAVGRRGRFREPGFARECRRSQARTAPRITPQSLGRAGGE